MDNNEMKETKEATGGVTEQAAEAAPEAKKKSKKTVIIVVAIVVLAVAAVAAYFYWQKPATVEPEAASDSAMYAVVLDENGEPVTDENGEKVTVEAVTDANGNVVVTTPDGSTVPVSSISPKNGGTETTTAGGNSGGNGSAETTTAAPTVKKPDAPANVTGLKVTNAKEDSLTIKWDKVKCDGYQVSYSEDNIHWNYYPSELKNLYTKNSLEFNDLKPYTRYYFSVRAYNINDAGATASDWTDTIYGDTLAVEEEREITVSVKLPFDAGTTDTVEIWVKEDGAKDYVKALDEDPVILMDGTTYSVTLPKKYKGVVTVWVGLSSHGVNDSQKVGGYEVSFNLTSIGMDTVADDDVDF